MHALALPPLVAAGEPAGESADSTDEERALVEAVSRGLADDAAGRVMDTKALKASLEKELGPIARP